MTAYLEIEDAVQVIDRYGFPIRDIGLVASALARPGGSVPPADRRQQADCLDADGLMLWINGFRHDFSIDDGFDLVVGVAAVDISLEESAGTIAAYLVKRVAM